jgi:hypothetical protein
MIGRYPSFDEALRQRDEDVVDQLRAAGGRYLRVDHLIVGPGVGGQITACPVMTALGVQPPGLFPPVQAVLDEARHWLAVIQSRCPALHLTVPAFTLRSPD